MKKLHAITVRGKHKKWQFETWVDPKYIDDWRSDGIDIAEVLNSIPKWWVDAGLSSHVWCFFEDIFNFRNPFS